MSAPTEHEIRAAIEDFAVENGYGVDALRDAREDFDAVLDIPCMNVYGPEGRSADAKIARWEIWANLSAPEAFALRKISTAAQERAVERATEVIIQEFVAAGLEFANLHPDAPHAPRGA